MNLQTSFKNSTTKLDNSNSKQAVSPSNTIVEQKIYKLGVATFGSQIKIRQYLRLFNGNVLELLQKELWNFNKMSTDQIQRWEKIFKLMKITQVKIFNYSPTQNPNILKQIETVCFSELKQINLFNAHILNYDSFAYLTIPKLQKINIIYNYCANLKPFNKLHIPLVKQFCVYIKPNNFLLGDNQIHKVESHCIQQFERWGFGLRQLRLQKSQYDRVMIQDLSRIAKCKQQLQRVYINDRTRIKQDKSLKSIKQKQKIQFMKFNATTNQFEEIKFQNI